MRELRPLGRTGRFYECPRWHEGTWWVSDFYDHRVSTVGEDGRTTTVAEVAGQPGGLGWLPDGSLLIVSMRERAVLRLTEDGLRPYADLTGVFTGFANDMTVGGGGVAYVGNFGFDLQDPAARTTPTVLAMISPDGSVRVAAENLHFPNACAITADGRTLVVNETLAARHTAFTIRADGTLAERRVWAQVAAPPPDPDAAFVGLAYAPDGGCLDAEDRMWVADALNHRVVLVAEGGVLLAEIPMPDGLHAYACGLGGSAGTTLLIAAAPDFDPELRTARTESVLLTTDVDVPRSGFRD